MRGIMAALCASLFLAIAWLDPAVPQEPDIVGSHWLDFEKSLGRADYAAADRALAAALDAAETKDDPRTVMLAYTLAILRLELGRPDLAHAPARQAQALSRARPGSGVEPILADLLVGRAELGVEGSDGAELAAAIAAAHHREDLSPDVFAAAEALGNFQYARRDYRAAADAWERAEQAAAGTPDPLLARARALTSKSTALFFLSLEDSVDTKLRELMVNAFVSIDAAMDALRPIVLEGIDAERHPGAVALYAEATAWESMLENRLSRTGMALPLPDLTARDYESRTTGVAYCDVDVNIAPRLEYPRAAARNSAGAVVVLFEFEDGRAPVSRSIIYAVPTQSAFRDEIEKGMSGWIVTQRITRRCTPIKRYLVSIRFR